MFNVDIQHHGLDGLTLFEHLGRMLHPLFPGNVGHVDQAIDPLFDTHKNSEIGDIADNPRDNASLRVLLFQRLPGIGGGLLQTEGDSFGLGVDIQDHHRDMLAYRQYLGGVFDFPCPEHLRHMDQSFNARFKFNKNAIVGKVDHPPLDERMDGELILDRLPGIFSQLLEPQGYPFLLPVEGEHLDTNLLSLGKMVGGARDAAPGNVRHMQQTIDAAQVNEETVVGNVLDHPFDDLPLFNVLKRLQFFDLPLLFQDGSARQDHIVSLPIILQDIELKGLADIPVKVSNRADIHLGAWKKGGDADIHGKTSLHPFNDRTLDRGILFTGEFHIIPNLDFSGFIA